MQSENQPGETSSQAAPVKFRVGSIIRACGSKYTRRPSGIGYNSTVVGKTDSGLPVIAREFARSEFMPVESWVLVRF